MRRPKPPDRRSPEEIVAWERVTVALAKMRKERRQAIKEGRQEPLPGLGIPWISAPSGGLPRGIKADPLRELCRHNLSTLLTDREFREFRRQRRLLGRKLTVSTVLRVMVCEYLEAHRDATVQQVPFGIDLRALCWRSRRFRS